MACMSGYLHRGTCAVALAAAMAPILHAQAPRSKTQQAFEVASIRRNLSGERGFTVNAAPGGRVVATNVPIRNLIQNVYRLPDSQIVGGPAWLASDRWDIVASAGGAPNRQQMLEMLKNLLIERFELVTHTETRELPFFALVVARSDGRLGPQLTADALDCATLPPGAQACGTDRGPGVITTTGTAMNEIAANFSRVVGRPVVNETNLAVRTAFS
jgi:uncharacterized protein (TIGR03435 family)